MVILNRDIFRKFFVKIILVALKRADFFNLLLNIIDDLCLFGFGLLWQQDGLDVWQDTTLCDCNVSKKLVQFLIVTDGQLQMTWDDACFLVITSGVTSELKNLGSEVLEHSGEVYYRVMRSPM